MRETRLEWKAVPKVSAMTRQDPNGMWRGEIYPVNWDTPMFTTAMKFTSREDAEKMLETHFAVVGDIVENSRNIHYAVEDRPSI